MDACVAYKYIFFSSGLAWRGGLVLFCSECHDVGEGRWVGSKMGCTWCRTKVVGSRLVRDSRLAYYLRCSRFEVSGGFEVKGLRGMQYEVGRFRDQLEC